MSSIQSFILSIFLSIRLFFCRFSSASKAPKPTSVSPKEQTPKATRAAIFSECPPASRLSCQLDIASEAVFFCCTNLSFQAGLFNAFLASFIILSS